MKKVEPLAPAGSMECLQTVLYFAADAVYPAGKQHGLRDFPARFTPADMARAVTLATP